MVLGRKMTYNMSCLNNMVYDYIVKQTNNDVWDKISDTTWGPVRDITDIRILQILYHGISKRQN